MSGSDLATIHQDQPVLAAGESLSTARAAMILLHGRGGTAVDILSLSGELNTPGFAYLAPNAADQTWYPYPFIVPTAQNEPYLSSALAVVDGLIGQVGAAGIPPERVIVAGFSQGACLALEYAARNGRRYGGLVGWSGGVIGADGEARHDAGNLDGTPVFLGCSDVDFHIPKARVEYSATLFESLGGLVTLRLYPGMGHTVNADEIAAVRGMMQALNKDAT